MGDRMRQVRSMRRMPACPYASMLLLLLLLIMKRWELPKTLTRPYGATWHGRCGKSWLHINTFTPAWGHQPTVAGTLTVV